MFKSTVSTARRLALLAGVSTAVLIASAPAASAASFRVLHDDRVGALVLPAGTYALTPFGGMTDAQAARRFTRFLQDFDGKLPAPWTLDVASATFSTGAGGFSVAPAPAEAPAASDTGMRCPGVFEVEHDDRLAGLAFPAGAYVVTGLRGTCRSNFAAFARLLAAPGGRVPAPWRLDPQTGTFSTGSGARFRVKPAQP